MRQIIRIPKLGTLAVSEETARDWRHGEGKRVFRAVRLTWRLVVTTGTAAFLIRVMAWL